MKESSCYKEYRQIQVYYQDDTRKVYEAEHERLKVRRLVKEAVKGTGAAKMLYNEAKVLSGLNSPFVPVFCDLDDSSDRVVLVEEHIEGETLEAWLEAGRPLGARLIVTFLSSLCDALETLDTPEGRIVHCDLKPSNIMVCGQRLRLIDFGAAVTETRENMGLSSFGSASFAAPEQKNGEMRTRATDIYAAGRIAELLCDCADEPDGLFSRYLLKKIRAAAKRATDEDPGCRYASFEAFKRDICGKGRKKAEKKLHSTCTVGVAGTHHGAGTTHTAVMLASYLSSLGRRVALVDLSETKALSCLVNKGNRALDGSPLRIRGIWVYPCADPLLSGKAQNGMYDHCILDLGCCSNNRMQELLRCGLKLVVTDSAPWREDRKGSVERLTQHAVNPKGWWLLQNFSDRTGQGGMKHLSVNHEWLGFSPDPFTTTVQNEKLFGKILSAK